MGDHVGDTRIAIMQVELLDLRVCLCSSFSECLPIPQSRQFAKLHAPSILHETLTPTLKTMPLSHFPNASDANEGFGCPILTTNPIHLRIISSAYHSQ
jgi:hypothetical protein